MTLRKCLDQVREIGNLPSSDGRSSSQQQYDQDDQEDCAKPAANIGAAIVEAATAEQDQQDNDEDYQIHDGLSLRQ